MTSLSTRYITSTMTFLLAIALAGCPITTGGVEGYVYLDGQPLVDATLTLINVNGESPTSTTTTTNEDGYYCVEGLVPATYNLFTNLFNGTSRTCVGNVEIEAGQVAEYDLHCADSVRIEGHCEPAPTQSTLPGIYGVVVLRPPGELPLSIEDMLQGLEASAIINQEGDFILEEICPGEWQLEVYYSQIMQANLVYLEYIQVTGEEEVISLNLSIDESR